MITRYLRTIGDEMEEFFREELKEFHDTFDSRFADAQAQIIKSDPSLTESLAGRTFADLDNNQRSLVATRALRDMSAEDAAKLFPQIVDMLKYIHVEDENNLATSDLFYRSYVTNKDLEKAQTEAAARGFLFQMNAVFSRYARSVKTGDDGAETLALRVPRTKGASNGTLTISRVTDDVWGGRVRYNLHFDAKSSWTNNDMTAIEYTNNEESPHTSIAPRGLVPFMEDLKIGKPKVSDRLAGVALRLLRR